MSNGQGRAAGLLCLYWSPRMRSKLSTAEGRAELADLWRHYYRNQVEECHTEEPAYLRAASAVEREQWPTPGQALREVENLHHGEYMQTHQAVLDLACRLESTPKGEALDGDTLETEAT